MKNILLVNLNNVNNKFDRYLCKLRNKKYLSKIDKKENNSIFIICK